MKPIDDALPEEREPQHEELLPSLQRLYQQPVLLTSYEQAQAVARVRERLLRADTREEEMLNDDIQVTIVDLPPQAPVPFAAKPHQGGHILRLMNTLAAVLVVGAIIGASILLFAHRSPKTPVASPTNPIGSPVVVHTQANHLEASMSLTPGPYFLSELIAADISLTNHSHTTYTLAGVAAANPCGQALYVPTTGGGAPHSLPPPMGIISCPGSIMQFKPGQTIAIRQYIALTDSGSITLTLGARFLTVKTMDGQGDETITNGPDPLQGQWPSLRINVNPRVPANRKLSFQLRGTHVIVSGPPWALSHLLYIYNNVGCQDLHDQGSKGTGNFMWEPIATNKVSLPGCPGKNSHWDFAFGAVGYAMSIGHYPAGQLSEFSLLHKFGDKSSSA